MAQKALAGASGFFSGFGNRMLQIRDEEHKEDMDELRQQQNMYMSVIQSPHTSPEGRQAALQSWGKLSKSKDFDPAGMFDSIDGLYGGTSRAEVAQSPPNIEQKIGAGIDPTIQTPASGQAGQPQGQGPSMFVDPVQRQGKLMQMQADIGRKTEQASFTDAQNFVRGEVDAGRMSEQQGTTALVQHKTRMSQPSVGRDRMVETAEKGFQPESKIGGLSSPQKGPSFVTDFEKRRTQYGQMGLDETQAAQRAQQDVQDDEASAKRMDQARLQSVRALTKQRQAAAEKGEDFKLKPQFALSLYNSARSAAQKQAELIAGSDVTKFHTREEIQESADRLTMEELVKRGVRPEEVMDVISMGLNQDQPGQPLPRPEGAHNPDWRPAQ